MIIDFKVDDFRLTQKTQGTHRVLCVLIFIKTGYDYCVNFSNKSVINLSRFIL